MVRCRSMNVRTSSRSLKVHYLRLPCLCLVYQWSGCFVQRSLQVWIRVAASRRTGENPPENRHRNWSAENQHAGDVRTRKQVGSSLITVSFSRVSLIASRRTLRIREIRQIFSKKEIFSNGDETTVGMRGTEAAGGMWKTRATDGLWRKGPQTGCGKRRDTDWMWQKEGHRLDVAKGGTQIGCGECGPQMDGSHEPTTLGDHWFIWWPCLSLISALCRNLRESRDMASSERDRAVMAERDTASKYDQLLAEWVTCTVSTVDQFLLYHGQNRFWPFICTSIFVLSCSPMITNVCTPFPSIVFSTRGTT